jgi:hypothetical protein
MEPRDEEIEEDEVKDEDGGCIGPVRFPEGPGDDET